MIDIGANLTDSAFRSDRDAVLDRAVDAGVTGLVITGTTVAESREAVALARSRPGLLACTAGVHPHYGRDHGEGFVDDLEALLAEPEVVAVGECGLDFFRNISPPDVQKRVFEAQLELAARTGSPVFLHERDASEALIEMVRAVRDRLSRAVVHCFTGDGATLDAYIDLDLHIGITGWICDERRGTHLREIVGRIPSDRLMIETDAPYLLPRTIRPRPKSRRNEPAHLRHVLEAVADCRGESVEDVARTTTDTARAFFGM